MLCRCFFHVGVPCFFSLSLAASFSQISMGFLFRFQKNYTFKWCIFPSAVLSLPTVSIHFRHGAEPPSQQRIHLPNSLFAGRDHHASRKHSFCWGKDFPVLVRCWPQKQLHNYLELQLYKSITKVGHANPMESWWKKSSLWNMDIYNIPQPSKNQKMLWIVSNFRFFCSPPLGFSIHLIDDGAKLLLHITKKEGGTP